ncbi:B12-binding domain-containing radical SAM protein [Desulfocurvibacter africanus]|uniref:B12-binding domain-containing radical SAM protein n=2 Tax=Desulfocurvibacter africanus TaxID=873 RepID=UPI000415E3B3|nr:radical SAM protein [Desulfocurvibacter africanus]
MNVLFVNPPNSGRSIPEERYGITSLKQIFRGEPLALEALAAGLDGHVSRILDLKAEAGEPLRVLSDALAESRSDVVGITGVTCEANVMLAMAREVKRVSKATVVCGGMHASLDPEHFNRPEVDYVIQGLGKASLRELVDALERAEDGTGITGVARTSPGKPLALTPRKFSSRDLMEEQPPRYDLVAGYRDQYVLSSLGLKVGFVASAYGCTHACGFCAIRAQAGGRYLTHSIPAVLRDMRLLGDIPVVRLIDANTFGDPKHAAELAQAIIDAGLGKRIIADVRSDTVVRHPELMALWRKAGLLAVIIGFEDLSDEGLARLGKRNTWRNNVEAVSILHGLGIRIVGDFIASPDYSEADFEHLGKTIADLHIDLPMVSVLTPLPGTPLYNELRERIVIHDLDYYTLTNAVLPTRLPEKTFYETYAGLIKSGHAGAKL